MNTWWTVANARNVQIVTARIRQAVGRVYPKLEAELPQLTPEALVDLARLVTDLQQEVQRVKNQAITQPWRMGR